MHFELEDDAGDKIAEALESQKSDVSRQLAMEIRRNMYEYLSGEDGLWADPIADSVSPVITYIESSGFTVDHPAAVLHEYGGTVEAMRNVDAAGMAFSWNERQAREARDTVPYEYFNEDGPFLVPPKMYLRRSIQKTITEVE